MFFPISYRVLSFSALSKFVIPKFGRLLSCFTLLCPVSPLFSSSSQSLPCLVNVRLKGEAKSEGTEIEEDSETGRKRDTE